MEQPVLVIRSLDVAIDLGAKKAARERMLRIAGDANGAAGFHGDEHRARVGAVVRARAANRARLREARIGRGWRAGGGHVGKLGESSTMNQPRWAETTRRRGEELVDLSQLDSRPNTLDRPPGAHKFHAAHPSPH